MRRRLLLLRAHPVLVIAAAGLTLVFLDAVAWAILRLLPLLLLAGLVWAGWRLHRHLDVRERAARPPQAIPAPPTRPAWLYETGCCDQWAPEHGCRWHTGRPAMGLAARGQVTPSASGTTPVRPGPRESGRAGTARGLPTEAGLRAQLAARAGQISTRVLPGGGQ
jgi:hypothetical protein